MAVFEALIHESARDDDLVAARHHAFILSHMAGPLLAALAVPLHWHLNGGFDPLVVQALAWMMTPGLVAVFLACTGALTAAYFLSSAILAALVGLVAAHTGGLASFALFWLLAVPVETSLSGSRKMVVGSLALCLVILACLAAATHLDVLPPSRIDEADTALCNAIGMISALLYIGLLAGTIEHLNAKSDRAVRDNASRFRLLAENATDVITRHGPTGDVSFVSGAAGKLVSCDPALLAGRGYHDLVHPQDRHIYLTAFVKAADTSEPATAEFRLASEFPGDARTPEYKWVELNCRPIPEADCETGACEIVAISRDVTQRRRRQEELCAARDLAEEANSAKNVFLANISHELRTPLNSVIGFAELLEQGLPDDDKQQSHCEYAKLIRQSGEHLLAVVNDLLDLSKIEAGQFTLFLEPIDLNEVANYCQHVMKTEAADAGVTVVLDLDPRGVDVTADQRACKQMLLNLLSNAIKFSRSGDTVHVRTASDETAATMTVQDYGRGIEPDMIAKLGRPFVQAEAAYSRSHDGAGLGLCIVSGLLKLHDGSIDVKSAEGAGTTVTVSLPVGKRDGVTVPPPHGTRSRAHGEMETTA